MSETAAATYGALQSRMDDLNKMSVAPDEDEEYGQDARDSYALSLDVVHSIDVSLALGGPTEFIRFTFSEFADDEPRGEFFRSWGNEGGSVRMTDEESATAWQVLGYGLSYAEASTVSDY